ncbi:DUF2306 domain-containing protein [Nocardioides sp. Root190]|uniref:DUF2306 domain-containing protein n=1 Tax=Nocardioides sp. Root190 TaxID=1736488 RepID=UPI00138F2C54|nr:DUF2306 domain-containing protein [Nocardioides sp. Root190]
MGFWVVALTALAYFPLAFTYFWHFFVPGAPILQDELQGAVVGHDFAFGHGSVVQLRAEDYAAHRVVMLVHTTTGAAALALATIQFSARLRATRPALHRWVGRVYLALMTTSMLAAYSFLLLSDPIDYFGGTAFDLQLWGLATTTTGSAAMAFLAIRRRDLTGHRAWSMLNISLMLTAPLLRVLWVALGRIDDDLELMMSLDVGSSALGVIAPGAAALAFMLTQRAGRTSPVSTTAARQYAAAVLVSAAGALWLADLFGRMPDRAPGSMLVLGHLLPAWVLLATCLVGAARAGRSGRGIREAQWRHFAWGVAWATPATAASVVLASSVYGVVDGFLAGQMLGAAGPVLLVFALVVRSASATGPRPMPEAALSSRFGVKDGTTGQ